MNFKIVSLLLALSFTKAFAAPLARPPGRPAPPENSGVCWKDSYGRGVGTIPGECAAVATEKKPKQVKSGLLCYPECKPDYTNVAGVCWQQCPQGFSSTGVGCAKPGSYGRGAGYPWKGGDSLNLDAAKKRCAKDHSEGCEQSGLVIYPKCKAGFHAVGCCVCSPNCQNGMVDEGATCRKKTYVVPPITPTCGDKQYDAGLCYKQCKPEYHGIGPVCWGKCPEDRPVDCGAMCGSNSSACAEAIGMQFLAVGSLIAKVVGLVASGGSSIAGSAATQAAKESAFLALKDMVLKFAKDFAKKLGKQAIGQVKSKVAEAIKEKFPQLPKVMAEKLAKMASEPEKFDAGEFFKGLDPTGISEVVDSFNKEICQ